MPQISYRANLSNAIFPFTLANAGRSVIVPGPDNNYDRRVDPEGEQKDAGIPQAIYLENAIPTANGYQTVGFTAGLRINEPTDPLASNTWVYQGHTIIRPNPSSSTSRTPSIIIAHFEGLASAYADSWGYAAAAPNEWEEVLGHPGDKIKSPEGYYLKAPNYFSIRGLDYLFTFENDLFSLDYTSGVTMNLVSGSVTGIVLSDVVQMTSSYNYTIAWDRTNNNIAWSSTTNPLDFTPSLVTGAGSASPFTLLGQPIALLPVQSGFYIQTDVETIYAQYTGNSRYPWKFVPIASAPGMSQIITSRENDLCFGISFDGTIWQLRGAEAAALAPEISTWARNFNAVTSYNKTTGAFTSTPVTTPTFKLFLFQERYLCLAYGDDMYSFAAAGGKGVWVYDILLKRYGNITKEFSDIWVSDDCIGFVLDTPTETTVSSCTFSGTQPSNANGVVILGKFQYVRSRHLEMQEIELEGTFTSLGVKAIPTLDGKTFLAPKTPSLIVDEDELKAYKCRVLGRNVSLALTGNFTISSVELTFSLGGSR